MLRSSHDACGCSTQTTSTINLKRSTLHPTKGKPTGRIPHLTPLILVRIQLPQPGSPVSGVLFPRWGESPTFPRVTRADPSLWPVICGISALNGRVSIAGLCSPFSNFRFGVLQTGSIADRDRFAASRGSGVRRHEVHSLGRLSGRHAMGFVSICFRRLRRRFNEPRHNPMFCSCSIQE